MHKIVILLTLITGLFAQQMIKVTATQENDLGIRSQAITSIHSIDYGPYSGIVVLDKKDVISVSSNIESIIKNIYVRELEHVKKGQKLLSIKSNTLLSLQKDYIEAILESENAKQNYERNLKLQIDGIISNKKLLESKKIKRSSDLRVNLTKSQLLTNGFSYNMLKKLRSNHKPVDELVLYASKSGVIHDVNVNNGSYVLPEHKMIEIYADGKRFIEITLPVKNVNNFSLGDKSTFGEYSAKVVAIGNVVNTNSQSVIVRAEVDDSKDIMINRVYDVKIAKKVQTAYKVKKSALVFEGSQSFVFKKVVGGFEVLDVEILKEGPTCYIVQADLKEGDLVAASSTSALLSAMGDEGE